MYIKDNIWNWFQREYKPVLKHLEFIKNDIWQIYNMDEKRACLCYLVWEEVVILVSVKEMYVGILENCILVTIIKSIHLWLY
jgi:hypothetical protein